MTQMLMLEWKILIILFIPIPEQLIWVVPEPKNGGAIMKKNLKFYISIIMITLIMLVGCSNDNNTKIDSKGDSAQTVVKNSFQYTNEKNKEKLLTTFTEHWNDPNVDWGFENLDSIKIINIEEDKDKNVREGYLKYGGGIKNGTTENNLKVYKVKYDVKYKKDGVGPQDSGIYDSWYSVIRKDENSPWLIDDSGV